MNKIINIFLICLNFNSLFSSEIIFTVQNLSGIDAELSILYTYKRRYVEYWEGANHSQQLKFEHQKTIKLKTILPSYNTLLETDKELYYISASIPNCDDSNSKADFNLGYCYKNMILHLVVKDKKLQFIDAVKKSWQEILDSRQIKLQDDCKEERKSIDKDLEPDG